MFCIENIHTDRHPFIYLLDSALVNNGNHFGSSQIRIRTVQGYFPSYLNCQQFFPSSAIEPCISSADEIGRRNYTDTSTIIRGKRNATADIQEKGGYKSTSTQLRGRLSYCIVLATLALHCQPSSQTRIPSLVHIHSLIDLLHLYYRRNIHINNEGGGRGKEAKQIAHLPL